MKRKKNKEKKRSFSELDFNMIEEISQKTKKLKYSPQSIYLSDWAHGIWSDFFNDCPKAKNYQNTLYPTNPELIKMFIFSAFDTGLTISTIENSLIRSLARKETIELNCVSPYKNVQWKDAVNEALSTLKKNFKEEKKSKILITELILIEIV